MAVVKGFVAYAWSCPCGHRNYEEGVPVELTPEDKQEIEEREEVDMSEFRPGDLVAMPEEVVCQACAAKHELYDPREIGPDI